MSDTTFHRNKVATCETKVRGLSPIIKAGNDPYACVEMLFRDGNYNRQSFTFFMEMVPGSDVDQASQFIEMLRSMADQIEIVKDRLHDGEPDEISGDYAATDIRDEFKMERSEPTYI